MVLTCYLPEVVPVLLLQLPGCHLPMHFLLDRCQRGLVPRADVAAYPWGVRRGFCSSRRGYVTSDRVALDLFVHPASSSCILGKSIPFPTYPQARCRICNLLQFDCEFSCICRVAFCTHDKRTRVCQRGFELLFLDSPNSSDACSLLWSLLSCS